MSSEHRTEGSRTGSIGLKVRERGIQNKFIVVFLFSLFSSLFSLDSLSAQQITRFAVVDLSKVYTAFFRDSRAVREFEERSARVQAEIDRMTREIQELRSRQLEAAMQGEQEQSLRLESEINRRSDFLREYYTVRTAELEDQRNRLAQSDSFLEQVHNEIRHIAESEGFSMVMRINTDIVWYSPTVDITDRVIQSLQSRSR